MNSSYTKNPEIGPLTKGCERHGQPHHSLPWKDCEGEDDVDDGVDG